MELKNLYAIHEIREEDVQYNMARAVLESVVLSKRI